MTKPTRKHIDAIITAQNVLESGVDVSNNPTLAKVLKRDIGLLSEVRLMLYVIIENPTLPFVDVYEDPCVPVLNPIEEEPNEAI